MYKNTDHPFVICFMPQTTIDEVITTALVINLQKLCFWSLTISNLLQPSGFTLTMLQQQVYLSSFSSLTLRWWHPCLYGTMLKQCLGVSYVMVVTTVDPETFRGRVSFFKKNCNLYLNSTLATKFYFDTAIPAIKEFATSLRGAAEEVFQCVDTMERIKKKRVVSVRELHTFISNSNEQNSSSNKAPAIGGEGGEATSPRNTVPAAKIEIGGDAANPAGVGCKDKSRKRPCG